jgi:hypothetical protein
LSDFIIGKSQQQLSSVSAGLILDDLRTTHLPEPDLGNQSQVAPTGDNKDEVPVNTAAAPVQLSSSAAPPEVQPSFSGAPQATALFGESLLQNRSDGAGLTVLEIRSCAIPLVNKYNKEDEGPNADGIDTAVLTVYEDNTEKIRTPMHNTNGHSGPVADISRDEETSTVSILKTPNNCSAHINQESFTTPPISFNENSPTHTPFQPKKLNFDNIDNKKNKKVKKKDSSCKDPSSNVPSLRRSSRTKNFQDRLLNNAII